MNIKILMSTMNKKDIEELKLNEKNISNCIIINQTKEQIKNIEKGDVVFYSYNEKGLAKSRNRLLEKIESDVDIGIITDDDVTFVKEYKDIVQKAYDTIKNADIEELDVETGAGSLDFYGTVEKEVDIDCGAGSVTLNLEGKVEDYNYELDSSAGSIEIGEDIDLGGLSTEKSIDNGSKRTIEISNGAGSVEIRFH